jgi:hypothetical protein
LVMPILKVFPRKTKFGVFFTIVNGQENRKATKLGCGISFEAISFMDGAKSRGVRNVKIMRTQI